MFIIEIWKVLFAASLVLAITADPLEKNDGPTKIIKCGVVVPGAHRMDADVVIGGNVATQPELSNIYSFPPKHDTNKTSIRITYIHVFISIKDDETRYDANIIKGGIGKNHVDLEIKANNSEPVHCHISIEFTYDNDAYMLKNYKDFKYIQYGDNGERFALPIVKYIKLDNNGTVSQEISRIYPISLQSEIAETGKIITQIEVYFETKNQTIRADVNIINGGIGKNHVELEFMAKNVAFIDIELIVSYADDEKVDVLENILPKNYIDFGSDVECAHNNVDEVVVIGDNGATQAELSDIYSFPPTTGIKITKIEVLITNKEKTTYDANIIEGGIGKNYVDLKIKAENVNRLEYKVFVYFVSELIPKKYIKYGADVEGTQVMRMNQAIALSYEEKEFFHIFELYKNSRHSPTNYITKIVVVFDMNDTNADYNTTIIDGGVGKDFLTSKVMVKNANHLNYQISVYYRSS